MCPGSHCRATLDDKGAAGQRLWDSRECPGPTTEAELSCPSPRRALTAGAIALAVIAPAVEPAEHAVEAVNPASPPVSAVAVASGFAANAAFAERPSTQTRSSRSAVRLPSTLRSLMRPVARTVAQPMVRVASRAVRRADSTPRTKIRRQARTRPVSRVVRHHRPAFARTVHSAAVRGGMGAVLAFARSQVGSRYVSGGEGRGGYDCSGFTKQAYAHAGLALPHSSGAQAARAHSISRSQARAGDLVVGSGHVGIYMGGGMMIDAGNRRVGVVYRHLFGGLHIERF
jgi:cell wall-associated NlpC family hydrolase